MLYLIILRLDVQANGRPHKPVQEQHAKHMFNQFQSGGWGVFNKFVRTLQHRKLLNIKTMWSPTTRSSALSVTR